MGDTVITDPGAIKIKRALISVSDKDGIADLAAKLEEFGVEILSTGGTYKLLKEAGIAVTEVSDHTGFPEVMDGRVKTLHPTIHGGLLARRDDKNHVQAMEDNNIAEIDMLIVNLTPGCCLQVMRARRGAGLMQVQVVPDCIRLADVAKQQRKQP